MTYVPIILYHVFSINKIRRNKITGHPPTRVQFLKSNSSKRLEEEPDYRQ